MKRLLPMLFLTTVALWLTGCGFSDEQRAQNTAKAFAEAMGREDRQALKETVTAKAWGNLSSQTENKEPKQSQASYSVGKAVVTDENAQVPVTVTENGKETPIHVILRREDREWRVYAMTFPTQFGGSDITMDFEHPETIMGDMFKSMGEAMGAMFKGMGEGMGAMMKGMQEGMKSANLPANSSSPPAPQ